MVTKRYNRYDDAVLVSCSRVTQDSHFNSVQFTLVRRRSTVQLIQLSCGVLCVHLSRSVQCTLFSTVCCDLVQFSQVTQCSRISLVQFMSEQFYYTEKLI